MILCAVFVFSFQWYMMSALDDAEWEELLSKVKRQGESLDSAGRRRMMTQLSEVLGNPSRERMTGPAVQRFGQGNSDHFQELRIRNRE